MAESRAQGTATLRFSYFDSACGCLHFDLAVGIADDLDGQISGALAEHDRKWRAQRLSEIAAGVLEREYPGTLAHEWHHSLQSIFYPYQYLQSWREFVVGVDVIGSIREQAGRIFARRIGVDQSTRNTITSSTMLWRFQVENGQLVLVAGDPSRRGRYDFTHVDLLEEATGIFQYRLQVGGEGTGYRYRQWLRSTRSTYSNIYRLFAQLLGEEAAYVALPPLVQVAFSTTWPAPVLRYLFNFT